MNASTSLQRNKTTRGQLLTLGSPQPRLANPSMRRHLQGFIHERLDGVLPSDFTGVDQAPSHEAHSTRCLIYSRTAANPSRCQARTQCGIACVAVFLFYGRRRERRWHPRVTTLGGRSSFGVQTSIALVPSFIRREGENRPARWNISIIIRP